MRILVTGASGFVGFHLAKELEDHGHEVIGTDIADADLAQPGAAETLIRRTEPEYICHLAARYGRLLCRDEPFRAVVDNAAMTTEIAAEAARWAIPVLYTSSSEVYGDHGEDSINEGSHLRQPTTIYGLSKRWGEDAMFLYLSPRQRLIVRMNMLYGPRQQAGYGRCALATFIESALKGESFSVHEGASRSWLYIADAVRALRLLVEEASYGIFNLGNDLEEPLAMTTLADMVCLGCGASNDLQSRVEPPQGQIRHKRYDCRKLRREIEWLPDTSLASGVRQTINWEQHRLGRHADAIADRRDAANAQ